MLRQYRVPTILTTYTPYAKIVGMSNTTEAPVKCGRCHRVLRSARSCREGYGPGCRAIMRAAAIAAAVKGFAEAQIEKARELIADGGLVPTKRHGVFLAVSSDGERTYLTHSETCACPSGLKRLTACTCKHSLAVRIIMASRPALAA